ncbi:MAG TPA: toll/interleukin-1 receptor domain-containing protein [Pyrinomonadaceae bacterium]|jgi:hypothetical protein|nr:toll/interleukin-1 receptor domain-containing protein [Pyrinomonadaceae bacterium]
MAMTDEHSITIPRVFISYSWSSEDHQQWVLDLAKKLMSDGVAVIIDRWDLKPGQDKYHFMEQMVKDESINRVLIICDKTYTEKADKREDTGVSTETQIISREVYSAVAQEKFIPVVKEKTDEGRPYIPVFIQSRIYVDLSDPQTFYENYEELLRNIYNKPLLSKPALGKPPAYITDPSKSVLETTHKLRALKDAILHDKGYAVGYADDYLSLLGSALDSFTLEVGSASWTVLRDKVLTRLEDTRPYKDEYVEFITFIARYGSDERLYDAIHAFFSKSLRFLNLHEYRNPRFDVQKFLIYELFLYTIAALIKRDRFREVNSLLTQLYHDPGDRSGLGNERSIYNYCIFQPDIQSIENTQGSRNAYSRISPSAELIRNRIDRTGGITSEDLFEADYMLFIRFLLHRETMAKHGQLLSWAPKTIGQAHNTLTFPIFLKGTSKAFFNKLKLLLDVKDKDELVARFDQLCAEKGIPTFDSIWGDPCERHRNFMNLDRLDTI